MSRHAELMDAAGFWRQFPVHVTWDTPGQTVEGTILDLVSHRNPAGEYIPKLRIQEGNGQVRILLIGQARLLAILNEKQPAKGDWISIKYLGLDDTAPFGLNHAKRFEVEGRRKGSQARTKDGEAAAGVAAATAVDGTSGPGK